MKSTISSHLPLRAAIHALAALLFLQLPAPAAVRVRMDAGWRFQVEATPSNPLHFSGGLPVTGWRYTADEQPRSDVAQMTAPQLDTTSAGWSDAAIGQDVFHGRQGFAWYRATLPVMPRPPQNIHFESVDDNATVYLNGKRLLRHSGWDEPFDAPVGTAWQTAGPNTLAVLVQNNNGAGGITGPVTLQSSMAASPKTPAIALPAFNDHAWRVVHLPHDYVVEGKFTPTASTSHGSLPTPTAWYRKTFTLPAAYRGKSVWIDFDGIYRDAAIWLNGRFLGEQKSGYIGARYDISGAAHFGGSNVLAVHVDPRQQEGWWYEGGGIYRHVWLNVANTVHIAPWTTFVTSTVRDLGGKLSAAITIRTSLTNHAAISQTSILKCQVIAPDGKPVATATTRVVTPPNRQVDIQQQVAEPHARLWSLERPQLYHLLTVVQRGGKTLDSSDTPFGIRTIRFDANRGFFLNGKPVKLKGTCNHQDFAGVGIGMPDSVLYWRIRRLKDMGSNAYRCSHNPVASELLDACDRFGMLVMDENRHLGDTYSPKSSPSTPATDLTDLKDLIRRDRNHPSVIMWSLCNEEGIQGTPAGARIGLAMKKVVNALDPTRPVTAAMNGGHGVGLSTILDLEGINYSPGLYASYHRTHPGHPVYGSETASTVSTRGIYQNDRVRGYVSAYDVNFPPWAQTAEDAWEPIGSNDYVFGGFAWTGFDYKGEPTPYGWPCINSHFGIMDECGFAKDNFYYYKAWWGNKPLVHILPHWNWAGKEGQSISVWCYSNSQRVELFLNGASLGSKEMKRFRHVEWSVPYAPGRLVAKAYNGSTLIATDTVETTGPPAALRLSTDRTTLHPDGEDVTMVKVSVVDAQGRVVPTADNPVTFQVAGAGHVAGVGNGDPSSHEPDKASQRHAFNGLCMVIVGAGDRAGALRLTASAPGLKPASLAMTSR